MPKESLFLLIACAVFLAPFSIVHKAFYHLNIISPANERCPSEIMFDFGARWHCLKYILHFESPPEITWIISISDQPFLSTFNSRTGIFGLFFKIWCFRTKLYGLSFNNNLCSFFSRIGAICAFMHLLSIWVFWISTTNFQQFYQIWNIPSRFLRCFRVVCKFIIIIYFYFFS